MQFPLFSTSGTRVSYLKIKLRNEVVFVSSWGKNNFEKILDSFLNFILYKESHKWWEEQRDAGARKWQRKWGDSSLYEH